MSTGTAYPAGRRYPAFPTRGGGSVAGLLVVAVMTGVVPAGAQGGRPALPTTTRTVGAAAGVTSIDERGSGTGVDLAAMLTLALQREVSWRLQVGVERWRSEYPDAPQLQSDDDVTLWRATVGLLAHPPNWPSRTRPYIVGDLGLYRYGYRVRSPGVTRFGAYLGAGLERLPESGRVGLMGEIGVRVVGASPVSPRPSIRPIILSLSGGVQVRF